MEQTAVYSGRFLGFTTTLDDYKLKYLRLETSQGEYVIKVPKELRLDLYKSLERGDIVTTTVVEKWDDKKSTIKRKALTVQKITVKSDQELSVDLQSGLTEKPRKTSLQVLICTKSDCTRRGGKEIYQTLSSEIETLGFTDCVTIKQTGCLKQCQQGPNVIILPNKKEFHHVHSGKQILQVVSERIKASASTSI